MENKKDIIKRLILLIVTLVFVIGALFGGSVLSRFYVDKSPNKDFSYESVFTADKLSLETDKDGLFRVLKINDTHFFNGTSENDVMTLELIRSVLDKTPCDFIVINGDLVDGFNLDKSYDKFGSIDIFASLLEEYATPWTFAPGNNDCEIDGSNESIIAFMMQYEHFVCGNTEGVPGSVNFTVDITNQGEKVHSLAIMDSGARKPRAVGPYQSMGEEQAQWLDNVTKEGGVRTSVFFHMPTNAFKDAYDNGESVEGIERYETFPYAEKGDDTVFDNVISQNELITLISCGHQHSNNMCSFYNGRYYQLSSVSGFSAMRNSFIIPSCTLTVINTLEENSQNMYQLEQIRG